MKISVWILGNQLLKDHPAVAAAEADAGRDNVHIVLVQSQRRSQKRPYHRKKLVLLFSAMHHYTERLRADGYRVDFVQADSFSAGLKRHIDQTGSKRLVSMAASDYAGRLFQQGRLSEHLPIPVEVLPNTQFLVESYNPIPDPSPGKRYVMESFYRKMRSHFRMLVNGDGEPAGGQWNYDKLNRQPLPEDISLPDLPVFPPDETTRRVMEEVAGLADNVGRVDGFNLAVTHEDAALALADFVDNRLVHFGPYEDAMTARHPTLFHSVLSPYINLGLLTPLQMVEAAVKAYEDGKAPINSVEGFIRQVIGWREFMYWQYWRQMPGLVEENFWRAERPMPAMFWGEATDMACIRHTVERAIESGYNHHIERLMILSNYCLLAGVAPQTVVDWFMAHTIDAYDWVMQPNVVGMGLNADGGLTATKPYIASANYINKMSDYCGGCRYNHRQRTGSDACPFNFLYWNFLIQNEEVLRANPRMGPNVLGLRHLDEEERSRIITQAKQYLAEPA